jgi:hypothetical protein
LSSLGLLVHHYPTLSNGTICAIRGGKGSLNTLEPFDAVLDNPIPALFTQLARIYADSRFILTVRDLDSWLRSCSFFFRLKDAEATGPNLREKALFYRRLTFGTDHFDRNLFAAAFLRHHDHVKTFFSGKRRERLLELNLGSDECWEKLCRFLGMPVPRCAFPHKNTQADRLRQHLRAKRRAQDVILDDGASRS